MFVLKGYTVDKRQFIIKHGVAYKYPNIAVAHITRQHELR